VIARITTSFWGVSSSPLRIERRAPIAQCRCLCDTEAGVTKPSREASRRPLRPHQSVSSLVALAAFFTPYTMSATIPTTTTTATRTHAGQ